MGGIVGIALLAVARGAPHVLRPVLVDHRPLIGRACKRISVEGAVLGAGDVAGSGGGHRGRGDKLAVLRGGEIIEGARAVEVVHAALIQPLDVGDADGPALPEDAPLLYILAVVDEVEIGLQAVPAGRNTDGKRGRKSAGILVDLDLAVIEGTVDEWLEIGSGRWGERSRRRGGAAVRVLHRSIRLVSRAIRCRSGSCWQAGGCGRRCAR